MRVIAHVLLALLALVIVPVLWSALPAPLVAPQIPVLLAAYLGVVAREPAQGAAAGAMAIGYLADILWGTPRGMWATVCGVVCVAARIASRRLLVRGLLFEALFAFTMSIGASAVWLVLELSFGLVSESMGQEGWLAVQAAALTGLVGPVLFKVCRRLDAAFARTQRERDALREGWLS